MPRIAVMIATIRMFRPCSTFFSASPVDCVTVSLCHREALGIFLSFFPTKNDSKFLIVESHGKRSSDAGHLM